ncbi:MAG TPA: methyltransferase [Ktedonobacteraceae bacterium]|nr:methyltransferase [Ktedonobacteraceae bacterium]
MSEPSSFVSLDTLASRFVESQLAYVAARLGLADLACNVPRTVEELAACVDVNPDALRRVMASLVLLGVFERRENHTYQLAASHEVLRTDHPDSIRSYVIISGEVYYRAFAELLFCVKTGKSGCEAAFRQSFFAYLHDHPETCAHFNMHMSRRMRRDAEAVMAVYDFAPYHHVVDIGGGNGMFLSLLLQRYAHLQATLFDLPAACEQAMESLQQGGVAARCEIVSGDFLRDELPGGTDLYLLSLILHDWDDEQAVRLLKSCRRAMSDTSRLVLVEFVLQERGPTEREAREDLFMLVVTGGRERTAEQFRALLAQADLQLSWMVPTQERRSVLEVIPVLPTQETSQ